MNEWFKACLDDIESASGAQLVEILEFSRVKASCEFACFEYAKGAAWCLVFSSAACELGLRASGRMGPNGP